MAYNSDLTQEELKSLLRYNPDTGVFTWLISSARRIRIGSIAGTVNNKGYQVITVQGKLYKAHRLAWLYIFGKFPLTDLDHINNIKLDNRISNLREATKTENNRNTLLSSRNTTGCKGVSKYGPWFQAAAVKNGRSIWLGAYSTKEEAAAVRNEFTSKYHGKFHNSGEK